MVAPFRKVTVPVGVPPAPETVAVRTIGCPEEAGFAEDARLVVVPIPVAAFTT